jgi:hypothetical protein
VTPRTLAAIAACARTLGATPDADDAFDHGGALTVGPLRATADRAALRRRFHNSLIHDITRPADSTAAALYDALEQARTDALGARWLTGVARNLLAFPGLDDDGLRWLAFECFSGMRVPPAKGEAADKARASVTGPLLDQLVSLAAVAGEQAPFARAAAAWCTSAVGAAPLPVMRESGSRFNIPEAPAGVDIRAWPLRVAGPHPRACGIPGTHR